MSVHLKKKKPHCFPNFKPYVAMGPASLPDAGAHVCTITKPLSTPSTNPINSAMGLASQAHQILITCISSKLIRDNGPTRCKSPCRRSLIKSLPHLYSDQTSITLCSHPPPNLSYFRLRFATYSILLVSLSNSVAKIV